MRETGPVSKVLAAEDGGDHSPTKPYIGPARTLLGALKNQMQLGGLDQGKMTQRMPDGTLVVAESRFGQDKITIVSPSPEAPPAEEWTPQDVTPPEEPEWSEQLPDLPLEEDQFAVCGWATYQNFGGGALVNKHAWVWKPGDPDVTEIPGPSGAQSWWANAISGDGRVVVGGWISASDGIQRGYRWSAGDGATDLGSAAPGVPNASEATGVSGDGGVIAGYGPINTVTIGNWVWEQGGLTVLAGSAGGTIAKVSPNGNVIFGGVTQRYQTDESDYVFGGTYHYQPAYSDLQRGALWTRSGGGSFGAAQRLPDSSAVQIFVRPESVKTFEAVIPYSILPGNVADDGTVCGNAPYAAWCAPGGQVQFITDPGTTPYPAPNGVQAVHSGPSGETTTAVGITSGGHRIAGNLDDIHSTFVWNASTGIIRDQPGTGAQLHDMSRDGMRYCGESTDLSTNRAALYFAKGTLTVLNPLAGSMDNVATGVASAGLRIPPVPPKPVPLDFAQLDS